MATTLMPIDPAVSPLSANRIPAISASLLPEETAAGRTARRALIWVVVMVIVVAGLCAAWFTMAYRAKQAAERDVDAATVVVTDLQRKQRTYAKTVQMQNEIAALDSQLKTVMAKDLNWSALLNTVRSTGTPSDIEVDGVNGLINGAEGEAALSNTLPATTTAKTIGVLTVTGTGPDKQAVAAYVDALATKTVVANPYVTSVATDQATDGVTFSLTVDITDAALCGRFSVTCKSTGGK